jgi:microcystin-dependent protein
MDPFLAEIRMFGGNFAPQGWAFCNGQLLAISSNTALFSLLGTTYGGDGIQTFALPNLQGRAAIHWGQGQGLSPYSIGQNGGTENVTLDQPQMPAHTHMAGVINGAHGTSPRPGNNIPAQAASGAIYGSTAADAHFNNAFISPAGGSQPHPNIQPYLCVTFIIALQGIFPSRS